MALTAEDLIARAESKKAVALAMQNDRLHCREAWLSSGAAIEFALKAVILRRRRLNAWPSRESNPELYTHDLRKLMIYANIDRSDVPKELRGRVKAVLDWDRQHDYMNERMPRRVARDMVNAVFGEGGVYEWLSSL